MQDLAFPPAPRNLNKMCYIIHSSLKSVASHRIHLDSVHHHASAVTATIQDIQPWFSFQKVLFHRVKFAADIPPFVICSDYFSHSEEKPGHPPTFRSVKTKDQDIFEVVFSPFLSQTEELFVPIFSSSWHTAFKVDITCHWPREKGSICI